MADAAAKREARRRKILENSESRLQRITGHTGTSDASPGDAAKRPTKLKPSLPPATNGSIPGESLIDSWNVDPEFQEDIPLTPETEFFLDSVSQSNGPRRRNFGYAPNGDIPRHVHSDEPLPPEEQQSAFFGATDGPPSSAHPTKLQNSPLILFLASPWVYAALAVVVNIMLVLKAEHLFGASIIVPFLLVLVGRFLLCNRPQDSQGASMLYAALILCNIRPEVIHRLKSTTSLFLRVTRELSFYMFSFVLIYYFFTSYWYNFDELLPNKAEIVVERQTDA